MCEICLKLTIKIPERPDWHRSVVFIVNFEHTTLIFLVFLLLTLNKQMLAGQGSWPNFVSNYMAEWNLFDVVNSVILKFLAVLKFPADEL